MTWVFFTQINREALSLLTTHQNQSPPPLSISLSSPSSTTNNNYPKPSSSTNKISPAVLFIIVILAVIFFISGLLHLLVRFLIKKPTSSSSTNRNTEVSQGADALQRQLQQLFNLHDSGLDQAFIDSLPVFLYKSIVGLKEPFDCAVCLCEFGGEDKLRLLPNCSHAFHIECIDTWLLSNSTCPLCRGTLFSCDISPIDENPPLDFGESRIEDDGLRGGEQKSGEVVVERDEIVVGVGSGVGEKKIVSVKLGKLRGLNDGGEESSSSNLDARRCYSMGSFQYVLGNSNLQVALFPRFEHGDGHEGQNQNSSGNMDLEAKRLSNGGKMESFSVSKIWLWSNKERYPTSTSDHNMGGCSSKGDFRLGFPWIEEHRNSSSKV